MSDDFATQASHGNKGQAEIGLDSDARDQVIPSALAAEGDEGHKQTHVTVVQTTVTTTEVVIREEGGVDVLETR